MTIGKKCIKLILTYNPHPSPENIRLQWKVFKQILKFNGAVIILGDFNVHYSKNNNCTDNTHSQLISKYVNKLQPLYQAVKLPTRNDRIIDLIFHNSKNLIKILSYLDPSYSDHNPLKFEINYYRNCDNSKIKKFIFSKFNLEKFNTVFNNNFTYQNIKSVTDPSLKWEQFLDCVNKIKKECVPFIYTKLCGVPQKTYNSKYRKLLKLKFKFWKKYKHTLNDIYLQKYKFIKKKSRAFLENIQIARKFAL